MAKTLSGSELVGFIKERQAKQVRTLRQNYKIFPRLAIIVSSNSSTVVNMYIRLKETYGKDILIDTDVHSIEEAAMARTIETLSRDDSIHGIIVQLPLSTDDFTDTLVDAITPEKDVDGLGKNALFSSATAEAINWLLAGYNVDLRGKKIVIVGNGRLVGAPLAKIWEQSNLNTTIVDENTADIASIIKSSEIIVTATGVPGLITSEMVSIGAVVVDAGTASEGGVIVGDVAANTRDRDDITLTPEKGGVGPLTVAMLFDHVIQSATKVAESKTA